MKKIILLALAALMMVGCNNQPDYQRIDKWQILELDSCEYIQADGYHGYVHKGNCRFCRERMQKELKYIVEQLKEK
jgi:uncharacterized lipoprotein NlpE involved in copper resistance